MSVEKIGVGIITCNRPEFFAACARSILPSRIDELVVVNDGAELPPAALAVVSDRPGVRVIEHAVNQGVCKSKNEALRCLLDSGCEHLFLIEDDILIKNPAVFDAYIDTARITGILHLMYGYHGPGNMQNIAGGVPQPRAVFHIDKASVALNRNCVGAFCYYHRDALLSVGLMDERLDKNCWEHVLHTYDLSKAGFTTPYWWFADMNRSWEYLGEQAGIAQSEIRRSEEWDRNFAEAGEYFRRKTGYYPFGPQGVPDISFEQVKQSLRRIYEARRPQSH